MQIPRSFLSGLFIILTMCTVTAAHAGEMSLLRDEEIEQELKTMTSSVFEAAGLSPQTVKFVIVDDPSLNAFVAGGQNIFLHTGLILETKNPAELIGVIAHETGHIAGGHLFRIEGEVSNLSLETILANVIGVAIAIGARAPDVGMAVGSASSSLATRRMLRHTRTQEGSADQAGVRFLTEAHLPISGFLSFMKKLQSQELLPESQQSEYVQTHPLTQDRVEVLQHLVDEKPRGATPPAWDELHLRIKAKLQGYLFPNRALQDRGTSIASEYSHAIAWFRRGQIDKAMPILDGLIKKEPENPYFYELKGQILFENGRIEDAVAAYRQAVTLAPFSGLIRIAYAHSLLESKTDTRRHQEEAVRQLTLALQKEKQSSDAQHFLGIAYGQLGQEGLSRLHLAEEALMQGKKDFAKREAGIALSQLPKNSAAALRAKDILEVVAKDKKDKKRD